MKDTRRIQMRDVFFNELYRYARTDQNIIILSNDIGAASLDKFRQDLPSQFINSGISEQNIISVAAGLALEGKKVIIYSIASFITLRCFEQIKIDICCMKLPVIIVGVGASYSYSVDGPTHHAIDDIAIMRTLSGLNIYSPSDPITTKALANELISFNEPAYIRLDREMLTSIKHFKNYYKSGYRIIENETKNLLIISTGIMTHRVVEVEKTLKESGIKMTVIDLFKLKPISKQIIKLLSLYKNIVTIEEHTLNGGLGSIIAEIIVDNNIDTSLKRIGINDIILYNYGERNKLQKDSSLDKNSLIKLIKKL